MSEEIKTPEVVEPKEAPKMPRMQYVFITLADGRRGAFAGPELIGKAELLLKPPTLTDIVFSEPRDIEPPQEVNKTTDEEVPSADTKVDEKPAGLV